MSILLTGSFLNNGTMKPHPVLIGRVRQEELRRWLLWAARQRREILLWALTLSLGHAIQGGLRARHSGRGVRNKANASEPGYRFGHWLTVKDDSTTKHYPVLIGRYIRWSMIRLSRALGTEASQGGPYLTGCLHVQAKKDIIVIFF